MIRTILAPATGIDDDTAVFAAALAVARRLGGHLDVLHVHPDPTEIAAAFAADAGSELVTTGLIERLEAEADEREERAKKSFLAFCERERLSSGAAPTQPGAVTAEWHREVGNETGWIIDCARTSDLLVVARPVEGGASDILAAALLDTGRPLLIPGARPLNPEIVAIAWKSTREAAQAVTAAAPFLETAQRIVIITVTEHDPMDRDSGMRLLATLQRHNPATEARHIPPDSRSTGETLLATVDGVGAGLLVMGGYSHNPVRELILGGVTEHVLRSAALPVLMAH
ncbi:MAG TPA: universal stress protein [Stellaceae bacterium]|jgi:nucleotide-binding universal stress UspA family protein|nr:universal stress protein [Stellaceae bacterium]